MQYLRGNVSSCSPEHVEIFPEDRDPPEEGGRLQPEEHAGEAGQVELPPGQRDLRLRENCPSLVDDEDCGENGCQVPVGVQSPQITQFVDPHCENLFHNISEETEDEQDPGSRGHPSLLIFDILMS